MPDPVATAKTYLGTPYVWGGDSSDGVDCSGLIHQIYPNLPRVAHLQKQATQPLADASQLQAGDLVFLHNTQQHPPVPSDWASHVGIFDGNGNVIHASSARGKVISVPLTNFTSNPNFYGFGRVAGTGTGTGNSMPKTKSPALASMPQRSAPATPPMPDPSAAFGQDGSLDPGSFLTQMLAARQAQSGPNLPYDPYSPTPSTDMFPNPLNIGLGQFGYTQPEPDIPTMNPSLADQRNSAEQAALSTQVMPGEAEQDRLKSLANLYKAQAEVVRTHPAPMYQVPDLPDFPQRQQAPIPTRPAPQLDPVSAGLSALAGLVDPKNAGNFGTMPLQAGISHADQVYADNIRKYQETTAQLAQQYEDQLAQRNDQLHYNREKAGATFQNAEAQQKQDLQAGNLGAQADYATDQAASLGGIIPREKATAQNSLTAQQDNRTIQEQLAQNAAAMQYNMGQQQRDNQALRDMLMFGGRVYGAQQHLQGVQDTNDTRETVGAAHDKSREAAATIRANATTQAAQIRANAVTQHINSRLSGLDPITRIKAERLGQVWSQSIRSVNQARLQAEKAFATSQQFATTPATQAQHDAFVAPIVQPYELQAQKAQQDFEAVAGAPRPAAGAPAPAPARPGAPNTTGRGAGNTLPPGFSNVRIVPPPANH